MVVREASAPRSTSRGNIDWSAVPARPPENNPVPLLSSQGSEWASSTSVASIVSRDSGQGLLKQWKYPLLGVALLLCGAGVTDLLLQGGGFRGRSGGSSRGASSVIQVPGPTPADRRPSRQRTSTHGEHEPEVRPPPDLGNDTCLEVEGCPDEYPLPYNAGEWPSQYTYSGEFPPGFIWGMGTASYQVEGAYREGGRGASIWDTFTGADTVGMPGADCSYCCKEAPCDINSAMGVKGDTGNVACDHYHMVGTDIALMKSMGLRHYRFSIAWTRIFPTGRSKDGVNVEGVQFYSRLIDQLIAAGIVPYVTLYHWDLPQGLLDPPARQAWWARHNVTGEPVQEIQDEFLAFVDLCFSEFGDRVKFWFTFNEPWTFTFLASGWGKAPCLQELSDWSVDPYVAGHNVLLAHAAAVDLYRRKYQKTQGGKIGITLNSDWREPKTDSPEDVASAARGMEFNLGWFADPIFGGLGDYPAAMHRFLGKRLPKFTAAQSRLLNGSADFFALNHYGTSWSSYAEPPPGTIGQPDGSQSAMSTEGLVHGQSMWLYGAAWGLRKLLNWVHVRYGHPPIYLTEGGWSVAADTAEEGMQDTARMLYYANYTSEILKAMTVDGVDVRGYFAWSLMDNFEWERGYAERFGTVFNDYVFGLDSNASALKSHQPTPGKQVRTRKASSCWLEQVWTDGALVDPLGKDFRGCATPLTFRGNFTDPRRPHCIRTITVDSRGKAGHIMGADNTHTGTCDGMTDTVWGPLTVFFSGGTIIADFSAIGGPSHITGFWDTAKMSVEWADGSRWISLLARMEVPFRLVTSAAHSMVT